MRNAVTEESLKRARKIIDVWCLADNAQEMDRKLALRIAEALDERNAHPEWPTDSIIEAEAIARYGNATEENAGSSWLEKKSAFKAGVTWIIARTTAKYLLDEKYLKIVDKLFPEEE